MNAYTLISITKSPNDGKEDVYLYRGAKGDIRFQAHPTEAWSWLFYKSSNAPKAHWNKLVEAFVESMMQTQKVPTDLSI